MATFAEILKLNSMSHDSNSKKFKALAQTLKIQMRQNAQSSYLAAIPLSAYVNLPSHSTSISMPQLPSPAFETQRI